MRMGLGGRKTPPHKAAGLALIVIGVVIVLLAMPLYVYVAILGALIAFVGYSLRNR